MKVVDVMSTQVDSVTTNTTVKEVSRLIFGAGVNGVPVIEGKKLVGFITERDILAKFYPTMGEYIEDPVHSGDFEVMENRISEILSLKVEEIMSHSPTTVTPNTPLLRAQSLMFVHKVGRLPVVNNKGELVGLISKGDIFRAVVGDKLPISADEEYHDWVSKHYDLVAGWEERLGNEIPSLKALFRKQKVQRVVDMGCGTGEHDIALAKEGFVVTGMEASPFMAKSAASKTQKLSAEIAARITFLNGNYLSLLVQQQNPFDAAIFMGNAFSHLANNYKEVLAAVSKTLPQKGAVLVMQILNFEKVFKVKGRFLDLTFAPSKDGVAKEHAFLEFYDPKKEGEESITLNMAIFDYSGKKWKYRSMNATPIAPITKEQIKKLLTKHGFKRISFFGSASRGTLFKKPFNPLESDWLNVVATR